MQVKIFVKGLVYKAAGQVLMRGADGCAEKHLTFQYATQCSLLIFNIMSCSVERLKALARACCFSAPPILRSRQNGASSAACVAEGAKRTRGDSAQPFFLCGLFVCGQFSLWAFGFRLIKRRRATGQGVVCNAAKVCVGSRLSTSVAGAR